MTTVQLCKDPAAWDRYVESHPEACSYHRWRWQQVIGETFGHEPYYLSASTDGAIQGVLPLFAIRSWLFGNFMVSVPFFSYGGPLAETAYVQSQLVAKAIELAGQQKSRHVELRQGSDLEFGWERSSTKVTMGLALPPTAAELWQSFSTGLRNKIRKGQKSGFRIQWGGLDAVNDFYPIFAANMRNLGTPVYPKKWFEAMCSNFPEQIRILNLWEDGRPVAGAFLSAFRNTLELPWSASLPDARKSYSHYVMYWTFIEWAIQQGFRWLDLGRCTPGSGTHEFKRHWGCKERALNWSYWLAPGNSLPELRPDNPRYHFAVQLWKRLPLAVANQVGPRIVRALP